MSSECGRDGTGWLYSSLYDSTHITCLSVSGFRGYEGIGLHEGCLEFMIGKSYQAYGFIIRHQTHELLSSQILTCFFQQYASDMLRGSVHVHWLRAGITGRKADHELSVSWELLMTPASWMYTMVTYEHRPARSFPKRNMNLTSPSWAGSLRLIIQDEAFLQGGVMCRDGFPPDWSIGFGFRGGKSTDITMTRFSLSQALNASFGFQYKDWHVQWIIRWHPYLGLFGGSVLAWSF